MKTAIVTDGKYRSSIAAVRALHRAGYQVIVTQTRADVHAVPAVASSRCCAAFRWIDGAAADDGYADRLAALLETYDHPVLFCVGAVTLNTVAAQRERFARIADFLIAPRPVLDALNDKETVHARAQSLGIPVPRQYDGVPPERYPVVIKPHCGEKFGLTAADRYALADTPEAIQATDELLTRLARENEVTIPVRYGYSSIPYITAFRDGNGFYSAVPEGMNATPADIAVIRVMPLESYTRMTGKEVSLEEDEVLVYTDTLTTFGANTLVLNHVPLRVKAELDDLPLAPKRKDPAQPTVHLVCRDKEVMLHLAEILDMENQTLIYEQSFNITGGEEAAAAFSQAVKDAQDTIPGLRSDSQYLAKTSWYASFGGFLFIGIFLGLLFMMAAVLIIYYKQISEGYDDHDRFTIMQKVGMSRKEVHRTIMKQIRLVFFLPLAAAALHIVMALKVMVKMLGAFALTNTALIVTCTGVTGVEMEALTAVAVGALTSYDMCKAVQKDMRIENIRLLSKSGGKSGDYQIKE